MSAVKIAVDENASRFSIDVSGADLRAEEGSVELRFYSSADMTVSLSLQYAQPSYRYVCCKDWLERVALRSVARPQYACGGRYQILESVVHRVGRGRNRRCEHNAVHIKEGERR